MPDDFPASIATSGSVSIGGTAPGNIETSGDQDWFSANLVGGRTYQIELNGSGLSGMLSDPYFRGIYNSSGSLLPGTTNDDGGPGLNSLLEFTAPSSGQYFLSAGGFGNSIGTYNLSLTDLGSLDDFSDNTGTTGTVTVGGTATGQIDEVGDLDWFAVELEAGRSVRIEVRGAPTDNGTLSDPYLRGVHSQTGELLPSTTNDDGGDGLNSLLEFTATETGTYYVSAGAFGGNIGTYTVLVEDIESLDDHPATPETTAIIPIGGTAVGTIEDGGDQDWFAVEMVAGRDYRVEVRGTPTDDGSLPDPYLRGIHDSSGALLPGSTNDDGGDGLNSSLTFTATETGTFFVSAGAFGGNTGTYTVSVDDLGSLDDYSDSAASAGTVAVDGTATGNIEDANDTDWFSVNLAAGQEYRIEVRGAPTSDGTLSDPYLRGVYDASETLIPSSANDDGGENLNSLLEFTAPSAGTYYIAAGAFGSNTGTYTVEVTNLGSTDDFGDTTGTAGAAVVGGSVTGVIEEGSDTDWFGVDLQAGREYVIDLQGNPTGDGTLSDPFLRGIHTSDGSLIPSTSNDDSGSGLNSQVTFVPDSDGTYFIAAGAFGSATGTYSLSVADNGSADDFGSDAGSAGTIPDTGVTHGVIEESGDTDWFVADMVAGHTYRIALEGAYSGGGTLGDPLLDGIFDASGVKLPGTSNDDGGSGLDSLLEFTPDTTGQFFIAASAFGTSIGSYRLQVEDLGASDDFADDTGTTGSVAVNGSVTGAIEDSGDHDWFSVTLEAGREYRFDLEGAPTDMGTLSDTLLYGLRDSAGNLIGGTANDDGGIGLNSQLDFTPTAAGTYFIDVGAFSSNEGTYSLSVTADTSPLDDFASTTGTTGAVSVGGSSTGNIETDGDVDWFAVNLVSGRLYQFDLEGSPTGGGTLSDTYIRGLHDSAGTLIGGTTNDDGGTGLNSSLTFTATSSGTFFVAAGGFGNNTGTYKVSVSQEGTTDDYAQTAGGSGALPIGGSTTGNIETAGDADWFAVSLVAGNTYQISLEGAATSGGTLADPLIQGIYYGTGALIGGTSNDDGGTGRNSLTEFTPTASGTYYVSAASFGNGTGTYKVSLAQTSTGTPGDDFGQTTTSAGTVSPGGTANGSIETVGDQDWFGMNLTAGRTYVVDLEGTATGGGTLTDPYIRGLYDASGATIPGVFNDDGGTGQNARIEFTPTTSGTYYVEAGAYSGTGTYKVSVAETTVAPPTSGFEITIDYSGDSTYRSYFENAAAVWEDVITGDLPDVASARYGLIDDLRIDASVVEIDGPGRILGQAGPRDVRSGSSLPFNGMMQFDSADLAGMVSKGILQDVIEHEMGHVLGLGTLWSTLGLKSGFNYTGANAIREYSTLLGTSATSVPLETTGGPGTAGGHWAENIFRTELMTGYAENSPPMPLSRLTIGSLEDMGYAVNYNAAEPYTLPSTGALVSGPGVDSGAGAAAPTMMVASAIATDGFAGHSFINFQDKFLSITATPDPVKLNGPVSSADETTVLFFENGTGNDHLVELTGTFEKNDPANAGDVKGTVSEIAFFSDGMLVARHILATPADVTGVLDAWRSFDLSGNNLLENRSATAQNDVLNGLGGDDFIIGGLGDDTLDGGTGNDTVGIDVASGDATVSLSDGVFTIVSTQGTDQATGFEQFQFSDRILTLAEMTALAGGGDLTLTGTPNPDVLVGEDGNDTLLGLGDNDRLLGNAGNDRLDGGPGADTLNGGTGDDIIIGGPGDDDLRDVVYAGDGNDNIDAGAGNDLVFGQGGNDTIAGGAGVDELQGQDGNDVITGSNFSDLVFGGAGNDFVNGGFGHDRINGGSGADKFFHVGVEGHGSDWVQDYLSTEGDVLLWGGAPATASDFQVNLAHTANDAGERSGDDAVQEAFVIYKPTEQIMWALVDGGGQSSINIQIGGAVFDLLA